MANSSDIMKIETWKGDWGIPSVDFACLQALALIKFSNAPVQNKETNNPFWSARSELPVFRHKNKAIYDLKSIQTHLDDEGYKLDADLTKVELAEITAYANLLKHKLEPAIEYLWWLDEKNYTEVFRKWYAKALPFPLNYYYPGHYERTARRYVDAIFPNIDQKEVIETSLFGEAEKCITTLSQRLGDQQYFFGRMPSSLDAIVYGYLAPLLKAPLVSIHVQNHLKACPNLVTFVTRITKDLFPDVKETKAAPTKKPKPQAAGKQSEEDFPHATRNKFLAAMVAIFAMLGYASLHGMIPVELDTIQDMDEMYDEDEQ